jgi:hypothetical protein
MPSDSEEHERAALTEALGIGGPGESGGEAGGKAEESCSSEQTSHEVSLGVNGASVRRSTSHVGVARNVGDTSNFDFSRPPAMVAVASVIPIACAIAATRAIATYGPARVIPVGFAPSALLTLGEWAPPTPRVSAAAIVGSACQRVFSNS